MRQRETALVFGACVLLVFFAFSGIDHGGREPYLLAQTCEPPGPRVRGTDCGGGDLGPPHVEGPWFCATNCGECSDTCEGQFGLGTPYLWDSVTGVCGCEPGLAPPPLPAAGTGTCSDTNGDGEFDTCEVGGDSDIACVSDADCTRNRHTECNASQQCTVVDGPGINFCGPAFADPLDDAACACADVPPSATYCGGAYPPTPIGNFGDPLCNFSISGLRNRILALDPGNVSCWMAIAACESGFNPNAFNLNAVDPAGAWGLFQMNRGSNGPLDHGDRAWCVQAANAIGYNNGLAQPGGADEWQYWACAFIDRDPFNSYDLIPECQ